MNSAAMEDILDRAFAIVERQGQEYQGTDRVPAEELNGDDGNDLRRSESIDQRMRQLTLDVHPTDPPVPVSGPQMDYSVAPMAGGIQSAFHCQPIFPGIPQQHLTPWPPHVAPQRWTVHPNAPIPQPQENEATPETESKSHLSAFICYLYEKESSSVMSDVLSLETALKVAGIFPRVDYREEELRGLNKNRWLEDCMESSSVIIICVNPSFKSIIKSYRTKSDEDDANSETYFLMDMLITKYRSEACRNYNVLPLLIAGAKYMDSPVWLQNTIVYRWPKDCEKLIQRILSLQD